MDLLMNQRSGDLVFINGKCPVTKKRDEVVAQRLFIRLRTFFGEWFLTDTYGVPWLERILGHKVRKQSVDAIVQDEIYKERGVAQITFFQSSLDQGRRMYSCSFKVRADSGEETSTIEIQGIF